MLCISLNWDKNQIYNVTNTYWGGVNADTCATAIVTSLTSRSITSSESN